MVRFALVPAFVLALASAAAAQTATIPTPSNPTPDYPVATDGTPLPSAIDGRTRPVYGALGTLPVFTGLYVTPRDRAR